MDTQNRRSKSLFTLRWVALVILMILLWGFGIGIYGRTFCPLWLTIVSAVALAAVSFPLFRRAWSAISALGSRIADAVSYMLIASGFFFFLILGINYWGADRSSDHEENAVVERLYTKTRYRTKRISTRRYGRGEPYKVYYAEIRFADGKRKEIELKAAEFARRRPGDTMTYRISCGALSWPVIKN